MTTDLATAVDGLHSALAQAAEPIRDALLDMLREKIAHLGYRRWARDDNGEGGKVTRGWRGFRVSAPIPTRTGDPHASAKLVGAVDALIEKVRAEIGPAGELLALDCLTIWARQGAPQPEEFAEGADYQAPTGGPFVVLYVWARAVS